MLYIWLTLLSLILLWNTTTADLGSNHETCCALTRLDIETRLSTKSPYRSIANYNDTQPHYPGCVPTRIWATIRHGTRMPSKSVIARAQERLTVIQDMLLQQAKPKLCAKELEQLRKWSWQHFNPEDDEKLLMAEGENELIELAERMQLRFPSLLPDPYDPDWYYMKYTATQRTLKSAQSFATGLFGRHRIHTVNYPRPLHRDPILRFYKLCGRWKIDVKKNPETLVNARRFYAEPQMQSAVDYVRSRTQLEDLQPEDVELMYTVCAFETAWQRPLGHFRPSVWCSFFDVEALNALEFVEDLEYYWNDGYGYKLSHRIACPAIADMFEAIDTPTAKANATFYFTHSGTLLKLLAHLGLAKDEEMLTHKHFDYARQWRTSRIDAFATNLAFLRFDCEKGPHVLVLHQEQVVHLPGCPQDNDLCPLATLRLLFRESIENCDFDTLCQINGNAN
ncbi:multiple inositol polyphosphate phosphatase 1 [Drosophila willistoni]|nr:multiple inositol polyphosphate phosphatase 1 [Drosophila willistoni]